MTLRTVDTALKNSLLNYDPFIIVHLVKFEKPQSVAQYGGKIKGLATDFTYITDAQYDISYQDNSYSIGGTQPLPAQIYRANKLTKLGTINESIEAKASNLTMTLDAASLGSEATISATFTSSLLTTDVDLVAAGFQEGDKVLLTGEDNTNNGTYIRLDSFRNEGKTASFTQISSISANAVAQTYVITLASEEINALISDKSNSSYTSYINREVLIYRAHIDPVSRQIIGTPYLYFKGITSSSSITEKTTSSEVTWTLSSHWGDFIRVQGRMTDDASHRALQSDGTPDLDAVLKPAYAGDLGFLHTNTAINHMATYNTQETKYKQVDINGGWPGGKRLREYKIDVPRQVDLQFNIQARMLPVIYGVRKIDTFPIFVDTNKNSSAEVYRADAICEGPIAGILDIHIDGNTTICLDKADYDSRNPSGTGYDEESVEILCYGRQDRGDTLTAYNAAIGNAKIFGQSIMDFLNKAKLFEGMRRYYDTEYQELPTGATNGLTGAATGILHEGTHTISSPLKASFSFHSGLENQRADNTLVSMAAANNFKVQNSYYTGTSKYWGPSHQLLDTAYAVGKYTIAEGETTLPELEFVVRGRDPECYNYDGSYKRDTTYTTDGLTSAFPLGSTVTIWKTVGDVQIGGNYYIIDKWSTFDSKGASDHRFRFSPEIDLGTTTAFYMKNAGGATWHMQSWDHAESSGSPASALYHSNITIGAGTLVGRKVTLTSPSAAFAWAVAQDNAIIGIYNEANSGLMASSYEDYTYTTNVIDNLTRYSTDPGIQRVYIKNAIHLPNTAKGISNYYIGNTIVLTDNTGSVPYIQERKIIDYDGSTKVALVDSPWDYSHQPNTTDTYSVGSIGDRRVTINPAMQLLDYMTNIRYGKGLDLDKDINLPAFINAARECDTRSDITIAVGATAPINENEVWEYPNTGTLQWRGTVKSVTTLGGLKQVVFTDVIGKLGTKWNSYRTFASGELYWWNGRVYSGSGSNVPNEPTASGALSTVTIGRRDTSETLSIDITKASANGNPLVKEYTDITGDYTQSGYSLYDGDDVKYWRYIGWDDPTQRNVTRHQMNQVVDTKAPIFDNINNMLTQFNGILRYSAGKYELAIKGKKGTIDVAERISEDDIVGTIKLSDKGLKNSKNFVSTSIIDPNNKFEGRSVSFFNSIYLKEDKGVQKKGQFSLPGITNYYNARFNIKQYLDESRYGLEIQFTMAPRGLLLLAGSIIELTYPRFGYNGKAFRITNLNFKKDGLVDVTADEHNDGAYVVQSTGSGFGVLEQPESGQNPFSSIIPTRPNNLQATQTNQGEVVLTWSNSASFTSATHSTEIFRGSVNNISDVDTVLIGTSDTNVFHDPITTGAGTQTRYYWIRYQVRVPQTNTSGAAFRNVASLYYPNTEDSGFTNGEGITGVGLSINAVRKVTLAPGATTNFVYQNDGTGIETGYLESSTLSTTTTNTAGTVTYLWKKTTNTGVVSDVGTASTYAYTPPTNFSDMPELISVLMTDTIGSEAFTDTASQTFTATKIVVNGTPGINGFTVSASNGSHTFPASSAGAIDGTTAFSSTFTVLKGATVLGYDGSSPYTANTYRLGAFANVTPANSVVPVNTNGSISISASTGSFLSGTSVIQATFDVPVIENATGTTIATFKFNLTKSLAGVSADPTINTSTVYAYQRSATTLTTNPGAVTVSLVSGLITTETLANGWSKTIPSGSDPLYITAATASGTGSTDTIEAGEWAGAVILSQDGAAADPNYTWIKYSPNADGTDLVDAYDPGVTTYVGYAFNKTTATESTVKTDYTWSRLEGVNADNKYTWVKYSANADGTGLVDTYTAGTTKYIGMAFNRTTDTESEVKTDYTWSKIEGEDGTPADPNYTWIKYSANADGTGLVDAYTAGTTLYIGMAFNKTTNVESTVKTDYTWSKIEGEDGLPNYTWIKYGTDASGANITDTYTAGTTTYVGYAFNKTTATESAIAADYTWSRLEGVNADNKYTWVKYSANADGTGLVDAYDPGVTKYIGMAFNKTTAVESAVKTDYTWSKIEGEDGVTKYTWVKYGTDASGANITDTYTAGTTKWVGHAYNKNTDTESDIATDYIWTKIEGDQGTAGYSSAPVIIYKRSASSTDTTKPTGNTTYTFATGATAFTTPNGWYAEPPTGSDKYLFIQTATASSTTATDIIADTEWSGAQLLSVNGDTPAGGVRGGSIFTIEESSNANITNLVASGWAQWTGEAADTFTNADAASVAAAVIGLASDSTIRPNDRITVTDNSANVAGTRIYVGAAATASSGVVTSNFSSLVVETFPGSVIVDGTLSASKVAANSVFSNSLTIGSNMLLNTSGKFYTTDKTAYADNDAGFFLGYDGGAHKLNIGNATNYIKWDGSALNVAGTIAMTAGTIGSTAASTIESRANGANQDSTLDILGGNLTGQVGTVAVATVNTYGTTAGGADTGSSRAYMNSNGLVVVDGSGQTRVKIGNLSAL